MAAAAAASGSGATKLANKARPSTMPAKTPLRRISRASLGALSASRNREEESSPLEHLNGPFAELAEAMEDLAVNFEALDAINEDLNSFNHGFGAFLYGLRMNAYASEFPQVRQSQPGVHSAS
jgi:DASH complex subunit DAM1